MEEAGMNAKEIKASLEERGIDARHCFGVLFEYAEQLERRIAKASSEVERLKDPLHPDNYEGSTLERLDNLVHELTGDEGEDDSFTVLRRRWAQLRTELRDHVVTPVINTEDYDEPTLTGWCCLLCDAEAEKRDALPHDMGCELYEAPK
jgi:hypothetical protein